jgi:hypothetical protein
MATVKRQRRTGSASSTLGCKASASEKRTLQKLYARLKKTQPGSETSKRISRQIIDAIG